MRPAKSLVESPVITISPESTALGHPEHLDQRGDLTNVFLTRRRVVQPGGLAGHWRLERLVGQGSLIVPRMSPAVPRASGPDVDALS